MNELLEMKKVSVHFKTLEGSVNAVDDVSFVLYKGRNIGIVGESGCGKSVMSQSVLRILDANGVISGGEILFHQDRNGKNDIIDIAKLDEKSKELKHIRGKGISMIFQEPMTSFCPVYTIGQQITEALVMHRGMSKVEAREEGIRLLKEVEISNPAQRFDEYPSQLSGGMRQRAMIAMALSCHPQLLIADEPTTALDVTIQAQILELLKSLQKHFGMTIMIISHNLRVIAEVSETVIVMYLGRIVEMGPVKEIFENAKHPYTLALIRSIPKLDSRRDDKLSYIEGDIPNVYSRPSGCRFHPRCPDMMAGVCDTRVPEKTIISGEHMVECHKYCSEVKPVGE